MVIRATTTESGRQSIMGEVSDTIRMEPTGYAKQIDWRQNIPLNKKGKVGDLIGTRFDLIAHKLIERGASLHDAVIYGHVGTMRKVKLGDTVVVSNSIEWRVL